MRGEHMILIGVTGHKIYTAGKIRAMISLWGSTGSSYCVARVYVFMYS